MFLIFIRAYLEAERLIESGQRENFPNLDEPNDPTPDGEEVL
jgi:hypothetical protein